MKGLIIIPKFYGYENQISFFLEKNHDFKSIIYNESDLVSKSIFYSIVLIFIEILIFIFGTSKRLLKLYGFFNKYRKSYDSLNLFLNNEISKLNSKKINKIIIFKGAGFSIETLNLIRNKTNLLYLYLWDSQIIYPEIKQTVKFSNKVFTYDIDDSLNNGWNYKPMFFNGIDKKIKYNSELYFCSYIAKYSFFRLLFCLKLIFNNPTKNFYFYFKFPFKINFNIFSSKLLFNSNTLDFEEVSNIYSNSKFLLSISEFSNGGFTQRIYDSFFFKKKCIVNHKNNKWNKRILDNLIHYSAIKSDQSKFVDLNKQFYKDKKIKFWISDFLNQI